MWKRRRTWLLLLAVVGLTFASLYESVTHVGRGWLRGEAFFDGRPTSYWVTRCDEWLERFESPEDATRWRAPNLMYTMLDDDVHVGYVGFQLIRPRTDTSWSQLADRFRSDQALFELDHWPPAVLIGYPDSQSVLEELVKEERYRLLVGRPLRHAKAGGPSPFRIEINADGTVQLKAK